MAKLNNKVINITGTIDNLSFYKMKGIEETVVRTKGGASKKKIKTAPCFEVTRRHNDEFKTAVNRASMLRLAMWPVKHLADYNITPVLNSLCKRIMQLDLGSPLGERKTLFSANKHLLHGFSLNQRHTFDSVFQYPVQCVINRDDQSATVTLPAAMPGYNVSFPWKQPLYRVIVSIGWFSDTAGYYNLARPSPATLTATAETSWRISAQSYEEETFTVKLDREKALRPEDILIVCAGIEMGTPLTDTVVQSVKHAGCAKLIMAG